MKTDEITLTLSLNEVNGILTAVGNLPYAQVFSLITKIQEQTEGQLKDVKTMHAKIS